MILDQADLHPKSLPARSPILRDEGRDFDLRISDFLDSKSLVASGYAGLRLAFCETIMTDAFSETPILVRAWTED